MEPGHTWHVVLTDANCAYRLRSRQIRNIPSQKSVGSAPPSVAANSPRATPGCLGAPRASLLAPTTAGRRPLVVMGSTLAHEPFGFDPWNGRRNLRPADRKSTRLNSSHTVISYAVFCLKKKTKIASTSNDTDDKTPWA